MAVQSAWPFAMFMMPREHEADGKFSEFPSAPAFPVQDGSGIVCNDYF